MAISAEISGGAVQLTGNPCRVKVTGGSPPAESYNYKLLLKLESEDGKLAGAPFVDAIAPYNGEANFDVSGYVDQPVKALFQYPPLGMMLSYPTQAFNVQFTPGESYIDSDGILHENWSSTSGIYQFLKGGLNPRQVAIYKANDTNFYDQYLLNGRFLTPRPWGDFIHPAQPVKLWYMVTDNKSAVLKVNGKYSNNSEETVSHIVTLNIDMLYEFNCNPSLLGLNVEKQEGVRLEFFDVWLESGGGAISDSRRLQLDWNYCERPFFLLFANSLGGIDDVYLSGYAVEGIRINGETVYKPQKENDTVYDSTLVTPNKQGQNVWKINSGYKSATQTIYLRDLMVARQAWLLYPNLNVTSYIVIPVIIENTEINLLDRKLDLWDITIEIAEAHTSQFTFDNRVF